MAEPVLWQFKYSHYNEKVRWALDFKQVAHRRRSLVPGAHILPMLWMTRQKAVPVLQLDGKAIADSTRIIETLEQRWPQPPLYPVDSVARRRALDLEEFFDEELGPHVRRVWFHELLQYPDYSAAQLTAGFSLRVQRFYHSVFPIVRAVMVRDMGITAAGAEIGRAKLRAAFDRLEAEIQPSGYLVGDQFSVADLTAAALFSPLVMPAEFAYPLLTPLPDSAAQFRNGFAERRGFHWVADMYRRHRGASAETRG